MSIVTLDEQNIGLALSGGMIVAATGGAAIMRGFQQQTILINGEKRPAMEAFDFVSGLSGGTIPTLLYSYAQDSNTNELLDSNFFISDPSEITPKVLRRRSRKSLFEASGASQSFRALAMILYGVLFRSFEAIWTLTQWLTVLRPFGIKRNQDISSDYGTTEINVIGPRSGVKAVPLVNFIALGKKEHSGRNTIENHFKVTNELKAKYANKFVPAKKLMEIINSMNGPDLLIPYIGSPIDIRNTIVGSKVNCVPTRDWGGHGKPCSLEFLLGMATNFLGMGAIEKEEDLKSTAMSYLSQVRTVPLKEGGKEIDMLFADGGMIDGLGVPALVQRKVRTIVASIWPHSIDRAYKHHYKAAKGKDFDVWLAGAKSLGIGDIASYFGFYSKDIGYFYQNHMFEDGEARLRQLRKDIDALYEAGKPIVVTMKGLKTVHNPFWGIEAGLRVDLTIILWTLPKDFAEKIPIESVPPPKSMKKLDSDGCFTNKEFEHFPNFPGMGNIITKTKSWGLFRAGALSRRQSNMCAYLGSWVINEAWNGLSVDGKEVFGGFQKMLQKS